MPEADELSLLRESVEGLRREVQSLRLEVEVLRRGAPAAPQHSPTKPAPAPKPAAAPAGLPRPPLPKPAPASKRSLSTEQFIGERLLHYVGIMVLAMGVGFFLVWRAAHTGPGERVFMSCAAGAILVALGVWLKKRPPYDKISNGVIGGGWTILYLTAYAAYHFDATKIVASSAVELALLMGVAAGMIVHALSLGSRAFRLFSFGLTYFVLLICGQDVASFEMFLVLLGASALIASETGHADILVVSAIGFYANYVPLYMSVLHRHFMEGLPPTQVWQDFFLPFGWLLGGYLIPALLPLVPRARAKLLEAGGAGPLDAALCLNALFFMTLAGTMGHSYFGAVTLPRAFFLSFYFALPGLAYLFVLPRSASITCLAPALGLAVLAWGVLGMPSPLWKMFAWIGASSLWVWIGLLVDHPAWRVSGLLMSILTFVFYFKVASISLETRHSASVGLFLYSALSYLASRYYRVWLKSEARAWEKPAMEYWLYVGSFALILALWGVLDPAPFVVVLMILAVLGEAAAVRLKRVHLWGQASALSLAAGIYTFFIDYGSNLEAAGGVSARMLSAGCVLAGMAYLYYADPTPEESTRGWTLWTRRQHRLSLSWIMAAVAVFVVFNEFGPRVRLPLWAIGGTVLYFLGCARGEEHLKSQGLLMSFVTAGEGVFSYLLSPRPLLSAPSAAEAALYWGSAFLLLLNLSAAKDKKRKATPLDIQASRVFCTVSLAMMALYLAKELESYYLTLAWSVEGISALVLGMALDYQELRYPSLFLLGLCVFKALMLDTSRLPLPHRVASFVVLGVVLILASTMYVRTGKQSDDKKNPPLDPP